MLAKLRFTLDCGKDVLKKWAHWENGKSKSHGMHAAWLKGHASLST